MAWAFAKAGAAKIAILGRTEKTLLAAKKSIDTIYPTTNLSILTADVANEVSVKAAFKDIKSTFGSVDILVSNAGYLPDIKSVEHISVDEWWRGYEVNIKAPSSLSKRR